MSISVFDLFSIGVGPSSSHTVGPMRAAQRFVSELHADQIAKLHRIQVTLYGSLAWTGKGHGTDKAIVAGLTGALPETVDPEGMIREFERLSDHPELSILGQKRIAFDLDKDLLFNCKKTWDFHSNAMRFTAYDGKQNVITTFQAYSVGGGFVVTESEANHEGEFTAHTEILPYPFETAAELLSHCDKQGFNIPELMMANEQIWRSKASVEHELLTLWSVMNGSIQRGLEQEGILQGGLSVKRRAKQLYQKLQCTKTPERFNEAASMSWLSCFAIAVNEENAAGGRVVTAPTNGAAGIIPAVMRYYREFYKDADEAGLKRFLLTAGAIGILYKKGASISAAEVGCQGEVGVACSMAAGGLVAALEGTAHQIEHAAEMGMEHHLGLTCDPVKGLVQIPCIERNAMGAVQAVTSAQLALLEAGEHKISLDQVIKTMWDTGRDMSSKYKETAQGGLALNLPEC